MPSPSPDHDSPADALSRAGQAYRRQQAAGTLPTADLLTRQALQLDLKIVMPTTPSKPLSTLSVPSPRMTVRRATRASISSRPKVSTAQALKGYDYLRSHSSRKVSANSPA